MSCLPEKPSLAAAWAHLGTCASSTPALPVKGSSKAAPMAVRPNRTRADEAMHREYKMQQAKCSGKMVQTMVLTGASWQHPTNSIAKEYVLQPLVVKPAQAGEERGG